MTAASGKGQHRMHPVRGTPMPRPSLTLTDSPELTTAGCRQCAAMPSIHSKQVLVLRKLLNVIDDESLFGAFRRFQFQPQLLLKRGED